MQKMRNKRKLISGAVEKWEYLAGIEMSLRLGLKNLSGVQEILVLALMLVFVFAIFYSDMEFTYKIGIAVLVFSVVFLTSLANQVLKQEKEKSQLRTSAQKNYSPLI
jgi:protein-S-isoprenylcysteine O-methyltransferase Ste14